MATAVNLRSRRRTEGQWHALAGVAREIQLNDHSNRRKYLGEYNQAFRSYERVLNATEFYAGVQPADIVLLGDYHALPNAQNFASEFLETRAQPADRPVIFGLETIFARDQHILDEWWRREIDSATLRRRIRFDAEWGYDWAPVLELLTTAREHCEAIYALDCMPREDLRRIGARDRHAAHKLREIRQRHPQAVIVVLFGESHLAPGHLPRAIRRELPSDRLLTVLQNVDHLYWQAAAEKDEQVRSVRVNDSVFCVFNATPLEKYENYRLHLRRWRRAEKQQPDAAPTIYNLIFSLSRFLGIDRYSPRNGTQPRFLVDSLPEVFTLDTGSQLRRYPGALKGAAEIDAATEMLEEQGCAYLPAANCFAVREFRMKHAAEEVSRFMHRACLGFPVTAPPDSTASFHVKVIEHALAYFGSRVLDPSRDAVRDTSHAATESGPRFAGYLLGTHLYDRYIAGRVSRREIRKLFLARLNDPGSAKAVFQQLAANAGAKTIRSR